MWRIARFKYSIYYEYYYLYQSIVIVEFKAYFEHVRSLSFEDRPDYDYLKRLFRELFYRKGYTYDCDYDWLQLQSNNEDHIVPVFLSTEKIPANATVRESNDTKIVQTNNTISHSSPNSILSEIKFTEPGNTATSNSSNMNATSGITQQVMDSGKIGTKSSTSLVNIIDNLDNDDNFEEDENYDDDDGDD